MAKPDIYLQEDRVTVVGGEDNELVGGTERGDLEVASGEDADPTIAMDADRANVVLGGDEAPAGIRLDGTGVDRNERRHDAPGTRIGVYADFKASSGTTSFASALATDMDTSHKAGIELGTAGDISPVDPAEETDGLLVVNENGRPATMVGGATMQVGNDQDPGRIEVAGGSGSSLKLTNPGGTTIELQTAQGTVTAGGAGVDGRITVRNGDADAVGFVEAGTTGDGTGTADTLELRGPGRQNRTGVRLLAGGKVRFPNMTTSDWKQVLPGEFYDS